MLKIDQTNYWPFFEIQIKIELVADWTQHLNTFSYCTLMILNDFDASESGIAL